MTGYKYTVILSVLVLSVLLSACGEADTGETAPAQTDTAETSAGTETDASNVLDLYESVDYGGRDVNILTTNDANASLPLRSAHDNMLTGDIVNDALYNRDLAVAQKFNVAIGYTIAPYDGADIVNMAKRSITAGDDAYDFIIGDIANVCTGLASGFATDMSEVPYLDFDRPWWNSYINAGTRIAGHNFYAVGDITPRNMSSAYVMMFSLDLFDDYGYDYPYEAARDGRWTLDMMSGLIKSTARDLDGDGKMTLADFYGMISDGTAGWCMYIGSGGTFVELDGENLPQITCNTEKAESVVAKLGSFFESEDVEKLNDSLYGPAERFMNKQGLFLPQTACNLSMFTDCEMDFGILPMPKYDEAQSDYKTFANFWCLGGVVVPATAADLERTGMLIEAMTALSHYTSTEAGYEITLLVKQTRDEESVEMLKLASENLVLELGALYNWGGILAMMETSVRQNTAFLPKFAKVENQVASGIEKLIEAYTAP